MKLLNIVVIEDSKDLFDDLEKKYSKLFGRIGYEVNAFHAKGQSDAQKTILGNRSHERIHVVVSDIVAGNTNDKRGLLWIQSLKQSFPDIIFFGNSGKEVTYKETSVKLPTFDIYVDKGLLNRARLTYLDKISQEFQRVFSQSTAVVIDPTSTIPEVFKGGVENRELNALVSQVLYTGDENGMDPAVEPRMVKLEPVSGGYSGSHVLKMSVLCGDDLTTMAIPSVLKVSLRDRAAQEALNFKRYVKWVLPYEWRVELLGEGETGKWGAVCYSFIRSGNDFDSVTAVLGDEQADKVRSVISKIFSPTFQTWYSEEVVRRETNVDISEFYLNEYFLSEEAQARASVDFRNIAQKYSGAHLVTSDKIEFPELNVTIVEPTSELFTKGRGEYLTTISHGDLNSNNILLADNDSVVFIDFQVSGRKHVFCDFITFEQSIRLSFGTEEFDMKDMIKFEGAVSNVDIIRHRSGKDVELPEMYKLILSMRRAAVGNFPKEPFENYLFGATMFSLRLLRIDDFLPNQYRRVLAQIISSMTRL